MPFFRYTCGALATRPGLEGGLLAEFEEVIIDVEQLVREQEQARAAVHAVYQHARGLCEELRLPPYIPAVLDGLLGLGDDGLSRLDHMGRAVIYLRDLERFFDTQLRDDATKRFSIQVGMRLTIADVGLCHLRKQEWRAHLLLSALQECASRCDNAKGRARLVALGNCARRHLKRFGVVNATL